MNIVIDPVFEKIIEDQIKSGQYDTPEDVVRAGLMRLQTEVQFSAEEIEELREDIQIGLDQADRGEFVEFDAEDIIKEAREILAKR
jgi:antitoxin ParD1/3/4